MGGAYDIEGDVAGRRAESAGAKSAGYVGAVTIDEVVESLTTLGIAHEVRPSGADGAILLLPEYGRVLGIWPHGRAENVLWVNQDFFQSLRVGAKDDGWNNPGGDRVWLAPAAEFLGEGGMVPPAIDPGKFVLSSDRGAACMANRGEAWAHQSAVRVKFRVTRRLRPLDEAALEAAWGPTWLRRAGCEEELELELEDSCPLSVRLWNITQVPPGSEITEGPSGRGRRIVCLEDPDSEHARLLVRSSTASDGEPGGTGPWPGRRPAAGAPGEFFLLSPPVRPGAKRRLSWKTSTCGFSGRSAEVRRFASTML